MEKLPECLSIKELQDIKHIEVRHNNLETNELLQRVGKLIAITISKEIDGNEEANFYVGFCQIPPKEV